MELINCYATVGFWLLLVSALAWNTLISLYCRPRKKLHLPPAPSALPFIGHLHLLGKLPHQSLAQLSQKHGPLMFLNLGHVPTVVVSSAAMAKEFLKTNDQIFASRPRQAAWRILFYNYQDMASAQYGTRWRQFRKLCSLELFHPKRMEATKRIRVEEAYCMLKSIRDKYDSGEAVNMRSVTYGLTRSVITRIVLNKKYFAEDSKEASEFNELVEEHDILLGLINIGDYIPYLGWLDIQGYTRRMKANSERMDVILDRIIEEHQENTLDISSNASVDFVDVLLSLRGSGNYEHLTRDSIKAVVLDMLVAGTGTAAVTIEWALSEILLNPRMQAKAQQELDTVVGRNRKVEEADLTNLIYLQSIVKETFRLHPTAPLLLPHESTEAAQVAGYDIPAKTLVLINVWAMGHDPCAWERSTEFDPERLLNYSNNKDHKNIDVSGQNYELIPFGSGRRQCPGLSLGLRMVQLALAVLLHSFHWSLPATASQKLDMSEEFGIVLLKAMPLHAIATPRFPTHLYSII